MSAIAAPDVVKDYRYFDLVESLECQAALHLTLRPWLGAGCFRCTQCKQPISGGTLMQKGDNPYHPQCYKQLFHPKCCVCQDYLPEEVSTHILVTVPRGYTFKLVEEACPWNLPLLRESIERLTHERCLCLVCRQATQVGLTCQK